MPYTTNEGVRINYQVVGEGPPIIFAHGFGLDGETWRDWGYVEGLQDDYKLILVDMRGHGRSDKLYDSNAYDSRIMAQDCLSVLEDVGIEKVHFWGYSLGGGVALRMAQYAHDRLLSLIIGGVHPYDRDEEGLESYNWILDLLEQGIKAWVGFWKQMGITPSLRERVEASFDAEALKAICLRDSNESFEDTIKKIQVPCLIYVGEDDDTEFSGARRFATEISNSRFISIPGLDHMMACVESAAVLPHVQKFLEECIE
jgi:pimeloyl-ACP methyl ester carboxylesterase